MRFSQLHVEEWCEQGLVIIPGLFTDAAFVPLLADHERFYGKADCGDGRPLHKMQACASNRFKGHVRGRSWRLRRFPVMPDTRYKRPSRSEQESKT